MHRPVEPLAHARRDLRVGAADQGAQPRRCASATPTSSCGGARRATASRCTRTSTRSCWRRERARRFGFDFIALKPVLERAPDGAEVMDPAAAQEELSQVVARIRGEVEKARALARDGFSVHVSTNLRVLESGNWRELTRQPRTCHMQALRQVLTPTGPLQLPGAPRRRARADRGPRRLRRRGARADAPGLELAALLDRFDASHGMPRGHLPLQRRELVAREDDRGPARGRGDPARRRAPRPLPLMQPRRILVRLPSWVGDAVMATPALRALRAAHPERLDRRRGAPGARGPARRTARASTPSCPDASRGTLARARAPARARGGPGRCCSRTRRAPRSRPSWRGIPRRAGYARDPLRRLLLTDALAPPRDGGRRVPISMIERYLRVTRRLGCPERGTQLELRVDPEVARARSRRISRGAARRRARACCW